jgi:hypothetical protein
MARDQRRPRGKPQRRIRNARAVLYDQAGKRVKTAQGSVTATLTLTTC